MKMSSRCQRPSLSFPRRKWPCLSRPSTARLASPEPWLTLNTGYPPCSSRRTKSSLMTLRRSVNGPKYKMSPDSQVVIISRLVWPWWHWSSGGYHAHPLPLKLTCVCWHRGPSKPSRQEHLCAHTTQSHKHNVKNTYLTTYSVLNMLPSQNEIFVEKTQVFIPDIYS